MTEEQAQTALATYSNKAPEGHRRLKAMLTDDALKFLQSECVGFSEIDLGESDIDSRLVVLPQHSTLQSLERFQTNPNRIKRTVTLLSCESFCAYVNRFKDAESTVYLDVDSGVFRGVLDHSDKMTPRWHDHWATFAPKTSLEWEAWKAIHKKRITQIDLALFVEENLDTFHDPQPNDMLKAALDFQSNENLTLASSQNLDNGEVKFSFAKDNVRNDVTFPHRVKLSMPIHENEAPTQLEARVRYQTTSDGVLAFTLSLVKDPKALEREALLRLAETIREETADLCQYEGKV